MAESTLSIAFQEIQAETGFFLGYGRGPNYADVAWTVQQQQAIDSICKSGSRTFYNPPALEGQESAYSWSFMHPVSTMQLDSGKNVVVLPDDYGGFEDQIYVSLVGAVGNMYWPVRLMGIGQIYAQQSQLPTQTGRPVMACEEPLKATTNAAGQRFQLRFWPLADSNYTIRFQYYVNPDYINTNLPYPLGGMIHAETLLEACLMCAEQKLDDRSQVHAMKFQERLQASISADRRLKPQTLGQNLDRSDGMYSGWGRYGWGNHWNDRISVYGNFY
jgi:hypothetical protein